MCVTIIYTIAIVKARLFHVYVTVTAVYLEYHSLLQRNSHGKNWNQHIDHEEGYNKNDIYNQSLLTVHDIDTYTSHIMAFFLILSSIMR